jgi:thiosulfate dehydrogenase [quinone] large subunit
MAVHENSSGRTVAGTRFASRSGSPETSARASVGALDTTRTTTFDTVFAGVRTLTGFEFLWAFLDKAFGWGYATGPGKAWIEGGSPTKGFLRGVAAGPLQSTFHNMAGEPWADWLFMLGLLAIGAAVMSGVALRFAAVAGTVMMALMWAAEWPPAQYVSSGAPSMSTNPVVDHHLLYAAILIALAAGNAGRVWGLGRAWERMPIVRSSPWLR